MKTKLAGAVAVVIIIVGVIMYLVCVQTQNVMAKETPFQAGYGHGCADSKRTLSERYIDQPSKGPQFHTQEFMTGYNTGFNTCRSHGHSSHIVVSSIGDANPGTNSSNSITNSSSLYFRQGYATGVSDAK